jgi:REP element-mobilizing transposase RayT
MTKPRSSLVSLADTPWYHCVSRCVRRAFLCGEDERTGKSYDHRRDWIASRIKQLANIFAIDIAAYAVMSNHYHIVLRIDALRPAQWDTREVLQRWTQLYQGPWLVRAYLATEAGEGMDQAELARVEEYAMTYRQRLADLSWFMRNLNQSIAFQANAEDQCKGHFWESRFKSQALLDEAAMLAAMAYVDLNPIRAGMAETPETSDFTSIQQRIQEGQANPKPMPQPTETAEEILPEAPIMPFDATGQADWAIPFAYDDYLDLVDWTGRAVHPKKRGAIPSYQPKILHRIGMDAEQFINYAHRFLKEFGSAVGKPQKLVALCTQRHTRYVRGVQAARKLFEQKAA